MPRGGLLDMLSDPNADGTDSAGPDSAGTASAGDPNAGPLIYNLAPNYAASDRTYSGTPLNPGETLDFSGGTAAPSNWQDFKGDDYTTGGGFFTMDELFGNRGEDLPFAFQSGANMASTNNYRLLPPGFNTPGYIMRNGRIININDTDKMFGPFGKGDSSGQGPTWKSGSPLGVPVAWATGPVGSGLAGWPGQVGNFMSWPAGY